MTADPTGAPGATGTAAAFHAGYQSGRDPLGRPAAGHARTTIDSAWLYGPPCAECGHTFREDDPVWIELADDGRIGTVVHHSEALPCRDGAATGEHINPEAAREFLNGLRAGIGTGTHVRRLLPGHSLLADPVRTGQRREACMVCGHSLRPYESVVICPCDPDARRCRLAVHQDPVRGLPCYDEYYPDGKVKHCPMNHRKLRDQP